jgi:hypothetical protein
MSIFRYLESGRLPHPSLFAGNSKRRLLLWTERDFKRAIALLRAGERARRTRQLRKIIAMAKRALHKNHTPDGEVADVKIIWKGKSHQ